MGIRISPRKTKMILRMKYQPADSLVIRKEEKRNAACLSLRQSPSLEKDVEKDRRHYGGG